jgi:plasmid maintenance system antidote protein VapI
MHNPPHPGEFIEKTYLENSPLSRREVAIMLDVAPSTFNRLIRGEKHINLKRVKKINIHMIDEVQARGH